MSRPAPRTASLRRDRRALAAVVLIGAIAAGAASIPGSGASFSSRTTNPGNTFVAAADWVAPTVAIDDPGTPLRGTVALRATASDSGSGLQSLAVQYAPNTGAESSYVTLCTTATSPNACSWSTSALADGSYKVRAVATDKAANAAGAVVTQRVVDNTAPTVTLADPGTNLPVGNVTLTATAADATSGVKQVAIQSAPTGTTTWTTACTATADPYSCTWSAGAGTYDLRAVATDAAGNTATSTTVAKRVIVKDTTKPRAVTVTATNGGTTAGTAEERDVITLRYSEPMLLSSILTGLNDTTGTALTVKFNAGAILGLSNDAVSFLAAGSGPTPNLGTIDLGSGNWITVLAGAQFAATATARTVNGGTEVTIVLGQRSGLVTPAVSSAVKLAWAPSAAATDLAGNAAETTAVPQAAAVAF